MFTGPWPARTSCTRRSWAWATTTPTHPQSSCAMCWRTQDGTRSTHLTRQKLHRAGEDAAGAAQACNQACCLQHKAVHVLASGASHTDAWQLLTACTHPQSLGASIFFYFDTKPHQSMPKALHLFLLQAGVPPQLPDHDRGPDRHGHLKCLPAR